jgi:para-nitrobenzyl esterase
MFKRFFVIGIIFASGCVNGSGSERPGVTVNGELLLGKYTGDQKVAAFLGVPFAEPPVGDLRWKAPQPLRTKQGQRDTTEFAPACMQSMRIVDWYRDLAENFGASADHYDDLEISEDCLYLNLWTATLDENKKLPVMVWIHGGSNRSGWSYEDNYRGYSLAPHGVIVVTVAYRQGAFGFLSHLDLADEDAVANFGMWDLIAALQWIQDNIEKFGGDPDRVTLFGESAGGENVLALMSAKPATGLFHRGIMQSAAAYGMSMPSLDDERKRGSELARLLGFAENGSLVELRDVPADRLLEAYEQNFAAHYHSPAIDGQLFTESNWDTVQSHRFNNSDLMIGTNNAEWLSYIDDDASVDDVVLTAMNNPRIGGEKALAMVKDEVDPRRAMDRLITANAYVCPSQNVAANVGASGGRAWMYHFTRVREDAGAENIGAYHGAEFPYVFGVHDSYMTTTDDDLGLTAAMQKYWVNFAATGNPNGAGLPEWPLFERPNPQMIELGDEIQAIPAIEPEMCASFEAWNQAQR